MILNKDKEKRIEGKITIPNLSEENSLDEIDITVTVDESNETSELLKNFMYNCGRDRIRQQIGKYIDGLRSDFAKNLILPKKTDEKPAETKSLGSSSSEKQKSLINDFKSANISGEKSKVEKEVGLKLDCKTLTFKESFQCKANELFDVFTKKVICLLILS